MYLPIMVIQKEMKMYHETRKIMHSDVEVKCNLCTRTCFRAHSESVWVETENPVSVAEAKAAFESAPGVVVMDNPSEKIYPMPLFLSGKDPVHVSRIRKDLANRTVLLLVCKRSD